MGSIERSRKKLQIWKKAILHFMLCFVMGFFTGFAPIGRTSDVFSNQHFTISLSSTYSPKPVEVLPHEPPKATTVPREEKETKRLVIVVTPTSVRNKLTGLLLRRLANTLRLVDRPLVWIVVEKQSEDSRVSDMLRKTGMMYRHIVFEENFTNWGSEMDHQRNIALKHIEHHRLSGIVHFAGLSSVYDLGFFEEIRAIESFGAWPIARLSANRKRVVIDGPVCDSSEVLGWHLNNSTDANTLLLSTSTFAFNSSILWDPERWGQSRTPSLQDTSQNSLKFVRDEVLEEETNLKGIPSTDCSKILMWDLKIPKRQ